MHFLLHSILIATCGNLEEQQEEKEMLLTYMTILEPKQTLAPIEI